MAAFINYYLATTLVMYGHNHTGVAGGGGTGATKAKFFLIRSKNKGISAQK